MRIHWEIGKNKKHVCITLKISQRRVINVSFVFLVYAKPLATSSLPSQLVIDQSNTGQNGRSQVTRYGSLCVKIF